MQPSTKYEKEILREISTLPEHLQNKLSRIITFLKNEMIDDAKSELKATEEFLSVCGKWKDSRSVEDQICDVLDHRKSTNRTEMIL